MSEEEKQRVKFLERIESGGNDPEEPPVPYQQIPTQETLGPQPIPKKQSSGKKLLIRFILFLIAFVIIGGAIFSLVWYFYLRKH